MRVQWGWFAVPAAVFLVLLFLIPFIIFTGLSFYEDLGFGLVGDTLTLANYVRFFSDPFYLYIIQVSMSIAIQTVVFSVIIGYPVAYFITRSNSRWSSMLIPLLFVSSFITVVIRALGWIIILRSEGPLNQLLIGLGVLDEPARLLNNMTGVVIGLVQFILPLVILALVSVLQTIPVSLEQAARNLGARPLRVFSRIILPLSMPGVVSISLTVFSLVMSIFTSVMILGGGRVMTLPVLIQQQVIRMVDYPFGATIALILVVMVLLLNLALNVLVNRMWGQRGVETA